MFEFLKRKKIAEAETNLDKLTQLKMEIETKQDELRNLIQRAFPIGGIVGIYCQKENPEYVVVGYLFIEGKSALLQIAQMNPRNKNETSISNISTADAKFHGFAPQLKLQPPQYEKE